MAGAVPGAWCGSLEEQVASLCCRRAFPRCAPRMLGWTVVRPAQAVRRAGKGLGPEGCAAGPGRRAGVPLQRRVGLQDRRKRRGCGLGAAALAVAPVRAIEPAAARRQPGACGTTPSRAWRPFPGTVGRHAARPAWGLCCQAVPLVAGVPGASPGGMSCIVFRLCRLVVQSIANCRLGCRCHTYVVATVRCGALD